MTRRTEDDEDIFLAKRRELWSIHGPLKVVKILPISGSHPDALSGYITIAKYLVNMTPKQIEVALGLPPDYLMFGARIFRFTRVPQPSEYTYELTAHYPDGLAYDPIRKDPRYGPGSKTIHQWKIRDGVNIPVFPACLSLGPGVPAPASWINTY